MGTDIEVVNQRYFKRGDVVSFKHPHSEVQHGKIKKIRNEINRIKADALMVLNPIHHSKYDLYQLYLVALCYKETTKLSTVVKTNEGELRVAYEELYWIDVESIHPTDIKVIDEIEMIVPLVLSKYDEIKKREQNRRRRKRKREEAKAKQKELTPQQKAAEQHKLAKKLQREYEVAIINNDTRKMQKIENQIGYAPLFGANPAKRKSNNYRTNPKPYSGGRFSPK